MTATLLPGNNNELDVGLGLERVGRATILLLHDRINDAIVQQKERWDAPDLELQQLLGISVGQVDLEAVLPVNLYEGGHRSLIDAPPEAFPNICVTAYQTNAEAAQFDQFDTSTLRLMIEVMVKAGPVPDGTVDEHATILERRIQRTTEAVHTVIKSDPTLVGTVRPIQVPPRGGLGEEKWVKRQANGSGPRYLWQGSRLEYQLQHQSS
jgi:hypothetical protein